MRTDVKLGIVLGLMVLAVLGWYMTGDDGPKAVRLADSGEGDRSGDQLKEKDTALPPPLWNPPADRRRTVAPPPPKPQRPGRPVAEAGPKPTPNPAKAKAKSPTVKPADRAPSGKKPAAAPPGLLAKVTANQPLSVKPDSSKQKKPPLVTPPGAKKPKPESAAPKLAMPKAKPKPRPTTATSTGPARLSDLLAKPRPKPVRPKAEKPKPKTRYHVVKKYDTFAILAEQYYGSQKYADLLLKANPAVTDARRMKLGTRLRVPPLEELTGSKKADKAVASDRKAKKPASPKVYVVKPDDSFYSIARELLGDGAKWRELHKLNRDVCPDPKRLRPKMKLRIPSAQAEGKAKKGKTRP